MRHKIFKQLFTGVLVLAIALQAVSFAAAAEEEVPSVAEYINEVDTLKNIGVLDGLTVDMYSGKNITRSEFVQLVTNVLLDGKIINTTDTGFNDVDAYSASGKFIYAAKQLGIINGENGASFNPTRDITGDEAYKILAVAMGYEEYAKENGGYPTGYIKACQASGISSAFLNKSDKTITTGEAAALITEAFEANIMTAFISGETSHYVIDKNTTWLYESKKILEDEGIVTGSSISDYYGASAIGEGRAEIDEKTVEYADDDNAHALLGKEVKYYYKASGANDKKVLHMYATTHNKSVVIDAADVDKFNSGVLSYYVNDKKAEAIINTSAYVIYNNRGVTTYDNTVFEPDYGRIELINNDSDSAYDVVKILRYDNYVVGAVNTIDSVIADRYTNKNVKLKNINDKIVKLFSEDGKAIEFKEIKLDDVISVAESKDGKVSFVYVSRRTVKGQVEASGKKDERDFVVVNGQKLNIAKDFAANKDELKGASNVIVYLNFFGEISAFDYASVGEDFKFIINAAFSMAGFDSDLLLKLLDDDGQVKTLTVNSRASLNGKKITSQLEKSEIPAAIQKGGIMIVKLNSDGEIISLETPDAEGSRLQSFASSVEDPMYHTTARSFESEWNAAADAKIFYHPMSKEKAATIFTTLDLTNYSPSEDDYRTGSLADLKTDGSYYAKGYAIAGGERYASVIAIEDCKASYTKSSSDAVIIKEVSLGVNEDGDEVRYLKVAGYTAGERELVTSDNQVLANAKVGDVIIYKMVGNEVVGGTILYDGTTVSTDVKATWAHDTTRAVQGNLALREGSVIALVDRTSNYSSEGESAVKTLEELKANAKNGKKKDDYYYKDFMYMDLSGAHIYCYDSKARDKKLTVTRSDVSCMEDFLSYGTASKVLVVYRTGVPRLCVVYK